jgi:hypothetical protein
MIWLKFTPSACCSCPFFWPKCYLSVFDLWIPITPLVSSNSSYINKTSIHLPHIHLTCCFLLALATACRRGELQPYHVVESCIRCAVDRSSVSLFTNASILTKNRLPAKRFWGREVDARFVDIGRV